MTKIAITWYCTVVATLAVPDVKYKHRNVLSAACQAFQLDYVHSQADLKWCNSKKYEWSPHTAGLRVAGFSPMRIISVRQGYMVMNRN